MTQTEKQPGVNTMSSVNLPTLNGENLLNERVKNRGVWEQDFDKNKTAFAEKISKGIYIEVIEKLGAILKDPYKLLPNKENTLADQFSFDIVQSNIAAKMQMWAMESAKLPPFEEWFKKFLPGNQKIESDNEFLSSGPVTFFVREKKDWGIEAEYFRDMMSLVGKVVESQLNDMFKRLAMEKENSKFKFKATWYKKDEQTFSNPSDFKDNCINVSVWIEDKQTQTISLGTDNQNLNSISSTKLALIKKQTNRKNLNFYTRMLQVVGVIVIAAVVWKFLQILDKHHADTR